MHIQLCFGKYPKVAGNIPCEDMELAMDFSADLSWHVPTHLGQWEVLPTRPIFKSSMLNSQVVGRLSSLAAH